MTDKPSFCWHGKRVFLTGHTGFKGGWLALWLAKLGAEVRGYSLDPATEPNLFTVARAGAGLDDVRGDIRDAAALESALHSFAPRLSSTWPRSRWCASPTTIPFSPTKRM